MNEQQWQDTLNNWKSRVLLPSDVIADSVDILTSAPHLGYLKRHVLGRLTPLPDESALGGMSIEEYIFMCFQDFFNMLLGDLYESGTPIAIPKPPHVYYEHRRAFLTELVDDYRANLKT